MKLYDEQTEFHDELKWGEDPSPNNQDSAQGGHLQRVLSAG